MSSILPNFIYRYCIYYGNYWYNFFFFFLVCQNDVELILGLIVSFVPTFAQPRFHVTRAIFFVSFGLSCVAPLPHLIYLNGIDWVWPLLWRELIMGTFYIIGAVVYATRFPEAKYPGKFDLHVILVYSFFCLLIFSSIAHKSYYLAFFYYWRSLNPVYCYFKSFRIKATSSLPFLKSVYITAQIILYF